MLSEETVIDQITITEAGTILVRRALWIRRDDVRIGSPTYARTAYEPGSVSDAEATVVHQIAALVWTPEVIEAARARRANAFPAPVEPSA